MKDFYCGRNDEFAAHKQNISSQLDDIQAAQMESRYTRICYLKVRLITSAWAKSHRPTGKLLTPRNGCNVVGGVHQGEMIVRLSAGAAGQIKSAIVNHAEDSPRRSAGRDGTVADRPSQWRCELGTIESITAFSSLDRLATSSAEITEWISAHGNCLLSVDLFDVPIPEQEWDRLPTEERRMQSSFVDGLRSFDGIRVSRSRADATGKKITIRLTESRGSIISLNAPVMPNIAESVTAERDRYQALLDFLSTHPMIRKIAVMPIIESLPIPSFHVDHSEKFDIPRPSAESDYPVVAVVDSGVSPIYSDWIVAGWDNIKLSFRDTAHGTFVSGLLINGQALNGSEICKDEDGCKIVDLCMLPEASRYASVYPNSVDDFLAELKVAVPDILSRVKVRVFNLSMNIQSPRLSGDYGQFARDLDELAVAYNIVFVISAGNLIVPRSEWSDDPGANVAMLSGRTDDIVYMPAESIRNFSVAALNPTDMGLASYSCRGKGSTVGVKPDFVHFGGLGYVDPIVGHGLYSLDKNGNIYSFAGTSFSAPLVAKTLASVEKRIEGTVSRETLMALAIQSAGIPESFKAPEYKPNLRDLIGYGMPSSATRILEGDEHSIHLVIASRIQPRKKMEFNFFWPQCLIRDEKCFGDVKVTLVSTPNVDYNFGDEMVREHLSVTLSQEKADGTSVSYLKPMYRDEKTDKAEFEWQLIEDSMKWQPVKVYQRSFPRGVRSMSPWTLRVSREDRSAPINNDGIPFTIILSISDPEGEANVYNEIRQNLVAQGITVSDIQTAARITQRV